jgi:nicotinamide-nucleotide adenylyltransferase
VKDAIIGNDAMTITEKRRGLYIGRFQPYHLGHHEILAGIAEEIDELVICIGSAQVSHELKDPFTGGERVLMVKLSIEELPIKSHVIPVMDVMRNSIWVAHVTSLTPGFEVVYSNNPLNKRLFGEAGFEVRSTPLYRREVYSGTEIRRRIVSGEEWESLVPDAVVRVIEACDGVSRMRDLAKDDFGI